MLNDEFIVKIGNNSFSGWTSANVVRSIESFAGKFDLDIVDKISNSFLNYKAGSPVKIAINNNVIINGFIDLVAPEMTANQHIIKISGRDKTLDLIDCSALNSPGTWKNVNLFKIAQDLCAPFNIKVIQNVNVGNNFLGQGFSLQQGESPFDAINRASRQRGIVAISNKNGELVLTTIGNQKAFDALNSGINIKSASGSFDYTNRFYKYVVKGQKTSDGKEFLKSNVASRGEAFDDGISRTERTKLIVAESQATNEDCRLRARWEAGIRAGRSETVNVMVTGFRQSNGSLWEENLIVYVNIPELKVNDNMLISEVNYSLSSDEGSITNMVLRKKDMFKPKPTIQKSKTNKAMFKGFTF